MKTLPPTGRHALSVAVLMVVFSARAAEPTVDFTVAPSDTLISLSSEVFVSTDAWREISALNHLRDPNRIRPGQRLKVPVRLLRTTSRDARLVSVSGDVSVNGQPVAEGAAIPEGQPLQTGSGGSAVIELGDGSRVRVPPSSLAQVEMSRQLGARAGGADVAPPDGWFVGALRVLRGSVEVLATKVLRAQPLEVRTPTAVVGVRGTDYRVALDAEANNRTRGEVVEGRVRFDTTGTAGGADIPGGFAGVADASGAKPDVVKLLPAPDLSGVPDHFERPLVRIALPDEKTALRVQIAPDAAFEKIISDQRVEPGAEIRLAGLDDARWNIRVRRIDAQGVEGFDAVRMFALKARPQPPATSSPRANAKQPVGDAEFAWVPNAETPMAQIQIASDEAFTKIVAERDEVSDTSAHFTLSQPGIYYWRTASVRASGDHGPFGDPQRFEVRPELAMPKSGRSADGKELSFAWDGRPQDKQQVELARDPEFKDIVAKADLATPEWSIKPPGGGRYFFHYRSIELDGYVTPFSDKLVIDVPRDWSGWLLLLPLLVFAL